MVRPRKTKGTHGMCENGIRVRLSRVKWLPILAKKKIQRMSIEKVPPTTSPLSSLSNANNVHTYENKPRFPFELQISLSLPPPPPIHRQARAARCLRCRSPSCSGSRRLGGTGSPPGTPGTVPPGSSRGRASWRWCASTHGCVAGKQV